MTRKEVPSTRLAMETLVDLSTVATLLMEMVGARIVGLRRRLMVVLMGMMGAMGTVILTRLLDIPSARRLLRMVARTSLLMVRNLTRVLVDLLRSRVPKGHLGDLQTILDCELKRGRVRERYSGCWEIDGGKI